LAKRGFSEPLFAKKANQKLKNDDPDRRDGAEVDERPLSFRNLIGSDSLSVYRNQNLSWWKVSGNGTIRYGKSAGSWWERQRKREAETQRVCEKSAGVVHRPK